MERDHDVDLTYAELSAIIQEQSKKKLQFTNQLKNNIKNSIRYLSNQNKALRNIFLILLITPDMDNTLFREEFDLSTTQIKKNCFESFPSRISKIYEIIQERIDPSMVPFTGLFH